MKIFDELRMNEWESLKFSDPSKILPELQKIRVLVASSSLDERGKDLRTTLLTPHRQAWEAAIFCYGMSILLETKVFVSPYEAADYDAVALWAEGDAKKFVPIQIKEVVPESLNSKTDLNQEIAKLAQRYPVSKDIVVVIHVNRNGRLDLSSIVVPKLNLGELWLIGASTPDQTKWFMAGDLLNNPKIFEFDYPT